MLLKTLDRSILASVCHPQPKPSMNILYPNKGSLDEGVPWTPLMAVCAEKKDDVVETIKLLTESASVDINGCKTDEWRECGLPWKLDGSDLPPALAGGHLPVLHVPVPHEPLIVLAVDRLPERQRQALVVALELLDGVDAEKEDEDARRDERPRPEAPGAGVGFYGHLRVEAEDGLPQASQV